MYKVKLTNVAKISGTRVEKFEGERNYLDTGNLKFDRIEKLESVNYNEKPARANQNVEADDVIFARMKDTIKVLKITDELQNIILSTGYCVLKPNKEKIDPIYLEFYLKSEYFNKQKNSLSTGATQVAINNEKIKQITIPLYDIEKQRKIADKLEKVKNIININKKQLEDLDNLVTSRFVEMFGDQATNSNNYDIVLFEELIEFMGDIGSNGANSVVSEHLDMKNEPDYALMVRFLNFTSNDFTHNVKYVSEETYNFFKKSKVYGGELIFCKIGSAGLNYIMPKLNKPVSLGLNQIMIRTKNNIDMTYLYTLLNTNYGKHLIDGCINGAVTKSITKGALKQIPIMCPPLDLQNQFAAFAQQVDKLKLKVKKTLIETENLKESLMNKYFG